MAFVTEKSELKPGLVLFRRGDVGHRMRYCRMKEGRPLQDGFDSRRLIFAWRRKKYSTKTPTFAFALSMTFPYSIAPSVMQRQSTC